MSTTIDNQGAGKSDRPYFGYYNPPPEAIATEEGPWIAAGVTLLLNTALTIAIFQMRPMPLPSWLMGIIWGILALMGVGLIMGSEACRWVGIVLVLLANGVIAVCVATGETAGIRVEPIPMFISVALSVAGWLLMLVRNPSGAHSVGGFVLVMAAHAVGFWASPGSLW